ncbi:MAG TPA: hypothetical protein VFW33_14355, partial [Gemmataceae bacterium]|nr:hypothetical protein [Gemmataceae bacterium]
FGSGGGMLLFLVAAGFGAALGFLQFFFESRGDPRSILLHRPLSRSNIFLAKALAGAGLYLLALGAPFVAVEAWMAIPGHMAAPYDWRTSLPWLADILAGLVYYFAGALTAQRQARWYGSRGLGLAAAFVGTLLVWMLPEFWQAFVVVVAIGTLTAAAAWGSFLAGGAYAPQPRPAKAALAVTLLLALSLVGFLGKLVAGQLSHAGRVEYEYRLDRQGRVLLLPWKEGVGPTEPLTDLDGQVPDDLRGCRVDRNLIDDIEAPLTGLGWPKVRSYRNAGRFYVEYENDSKPGREEWFYVAERGRVLGYDAEHGQFLGSYGPDGYAPAGQPPGERFRGELRYTTRLWEAIPPPYLTFPGAVYSVDFARHTVRTLFTAAEGETVQWASRWRDRREGGSLVVVSTDRSVHLLTPAGVPVVSVPRAFDPAESRLRSVGRLEGPERYVFWYGPPNFQGPDGLGTTPSHLLEYDAGGREVARRVIPPAPEVEPSSADVLFGLATPPTEAATLVGGSRSLRWEARATGGATQSLVLELFEEWIGYFIPIAVWRTDTRSGMFVGFSALSLLSSAVCAAACFVLAGRYAFSGSRRVGWALCGLLFGWVGLVLMLALQEWPARVRCPACGRSRRVDRERCEHCGAPHAQPARDGTEIFEEDVATLPGRREDFEKYLAGVPKVTPAEGDRLD